jgi:hypothetical protein
VASVPKIEDTVQQAPFIFAATVMKVGAATVASFQVQAGTTVVKVNRILRSPAAVGNLVGTQITVQLQGPPTVKAGDEAIFYARGLVFAESIVVQEVAPRQMLSGAVKAAQVARVSKVVDRLPDLQVQTHASEADLVIVGKVISVNLVPAPAPGPITHHDPIWQEAVVAVESVEVGTLTEKTVHFLFPSSQDVKWHRVPKFTVGMEGVFLLHRRQIEELKKEAHVVLDPMDFHPRGRVDSIRRVLGTTPTRKTKKTGKGRNS